MDIAGFLRESEGPATCFVERNLEQVALGADRLQRGLARLLEFALEPRRNPLDQFFRRGRIRIFRRVQFRSAYQLCRDAASERELLDSVRTLEAERQHD